MASGRNTTLSDPLVIVNDTAGRSMHDARRELHYQSVRYVLGQLKPNGHRPAVYPPKRGQRPVQADQHVNTLRPG